MTRVWHDGAEVFEVGTRVRVFREVDDGVLNVGDQGTVMELSALPYVQWDKEHPRFHTGNGRFPEGRIYAEWMANLEEVES